MTLILLPVFIVALSGQVSAEVPDYYVKSMKRTLEQFYLNGVKEVIGQMREPENIPLPDKWSTGHVNCSKESEGKTCCWLEDLTLRGEHAYYETRSYHCLDRAHSGQETCYRAIGACISHQQRQIIDSYGNRSRCETWYGVSARPQGGLASGHSGVGFAIDLVNRSTKYVVASGFVTPLKLRGFPGENYSGTCRLSLKTSKGERPPIY